MNTTSTLGNLGAPAGAFTLLSAILLFGAAVPDAASAQTPPRIMIAMDTSGSMALNLDGIPTFGDGVTTGCTVSSSVYCGANCTAGIDTDCDGLPDDSRIFVAKQALRDVLYSAGDDIEWSLSRFSQAHALNSICTVRDSYGIQNLECSGFVTSYGNPQCNAGTTVTTCGGGVVDTADWPASCRPGTGGRPALRRLTGSGPEICINYGADFCDGTAASGDVLVGFPGLGAFSGISNIPAMLRWIDNAETNFGTSTTSGNFCAHATTGDCELRPQGPTPLAGVLTAAGAYMAGVRAGDARSSCRPYSVILITDGSETCSGNPVAAATSLRTTSGIRTYVIGMAVTGASRTLLNNIATGGGTDAGVPGGDTAFFADDPVTLAAGLAQIIQDSLLVEVCNGLDDDCDTLIDEGVRNACGACGPVPAETCNGADEDCDGRTDEGVTNACGTCGPVPPEVCNGLDDDCNGVIDNGVCGGCSPTTEVCDGIDNDCDTRIDEGVTRACGFMVGRCTIGTQVCTAGAFGACSGIGPTTETCNNIDDDCDGVIDGLSRPCGSSTGACSPGAQMCTTGTWGSCSGGVGPGTELCNGIDDDCDTRIDEGATGTGASCGSAIGACRPGSVSCVAGALTCVGGTSPMSETCNAADDDCDGRTDESVPTMGACGSTVGECRAGVRTCTAGAFTCVGARGPTAELCNARDDDCDARTDESNPGGGMPCGTAVGECALGNSACVGGALQCMGGVTPRIEVCNGLDDDCDGATDEGNPGGGARCGATDVGLCEFGALRCVMGALACVGEVGPRPELCNALDDDCDAMTDEGGPEEGAACGDGTGECTPGTTRCVAGMLACMGAIGPMPETCNALDDDCDTLVDEDLGVGEACGTDVGECSPGFNRCEMGVVVCVGAIGPTAETCNSLDDDCDAMVDEALALGGPCGSDEGLCMMGMQQCIDGRTVCVGSTEPSPEGCDCDDNDCDGATDEAPPGGSLCPAGSACVECQCALPCIMGEFGDTCPTGRTPSRVDGMCFCVAPRCDAAACAMETQERDGNVLCAPDTTGVTTCVCRNNECTFSCDGVVCMGGLVCNPRDPMGRCVEDNCRGLGCADGEVCDGATGMCVSDPCVTAGCAADEVCRAGMCERSCATVTCASGERCARGTCVPDLCDGVRCAAFEVCVPASGDCIADPCPDIRCPGGTVCEPTTGMCVTDPCTGVHCPAMQICMAGECVRDVVGVDAGVDAGIDAGRGGDDRTRVLAAGGGGCICRAGTGSSSSGSPLALSLALLLGLTLLARRRRRALIGPRAKRMFAVAGLGVALMLSEGCDVGPFCLDCVDDGVDAGRDAGRGSAEAGVDAGRDAALYDAGPPDAGDAGCTPGAPEVCNGRDDDCDETVDEGIDTATDENNCGGCGNLCAPVGAFGECIGGVCGIGMCDVGRYDRDMDPANGCEHRCLPTAMDDLLCDLRDNDCDFMVDEDVDLVTDPTNCGRCGRTCRFAHAGASCVMSACALGDCDANFHNIDANPTNGCEYSCTLADPAVESCNGTDDDCDGRIDEGDPGGGAACGSGTGICSVGVERCMAGRVTCVGGSGPTAELCNGMDDDCDGTVDENNPQGGRLCGSSVGTCSAGRETCVTGALACVGAVGPRTETCDGLDEDCDTRIDEGDPGGGGSCGTGTGICTFGTRHCRGGVIACEGGTGPSTETCNGMDDDCDAATDEGNPGGGGSCGSDIGICTPGTRTCAGGMLTCVGGSGPRVGGELCNGLDDDCDTRLDEGNPGGGAACGSSVGACTTGTQQCLGGAVQCIGGTGPTTEICNTRDDDCDGTTDEGFSLATDVRNCGMCGRVCMLANAIPRCTTGTCRILACSPGFVNADGNDANGCEYACTPSGGPEVCNGRDDDCDTRTDEGVIPPTNFCNPNGVCAGTTATCGAMSGWQCNYPSTYEVTETRCDGRDNDCDGAVDEPFPGVGTSCANGVGACRRTGVIACRADQLGTICTAPPAGTPTVESCNSIDDDCNGVVDDNIATSTIPTVAVPRSTGIGSVLVMRYEASRPDATATGAGAQSTVACSRPNVVPWTDVTWTQARTACCALNPGGTCGATGWRLCDAPDWEIACEGPATGTATECTWSYASNCRTSSTLRCNGDEYDCSPAAGDQDCLFTTASPTFPMCYTQWTGGATARIHDMSGNAKEWTNTQLSPGVYAIRGGSYTNVEGGRTCQFSFTAGTQTFSFPNTGFRCCMY